MIRSQLIFSALFGLLAVPMFAQKTGCDMVTQKEASSILGVASDKINKESPGTSTCVYKVQGSTVSLVAQIGKKVAAAVNSRKAKFVKDGGTVKDEAGLGEGAYSAIRADTTRIYAFKGEQTLQITYTDTAKGKVPNRLLDKLRAAAKTALTRM